LLVLAQLPDRQFPLGALVLQKQLAIPDGDTFY
jgi:hypothetical protein